MKNSRKPLVGILMGSDSDWDTMKAAADACAEFDVATETHVMSAHRTPDDLAKYARAARDYCRGRRRGASGRCGCGAHPLPVIGVPIESKALKELDSFLSIVQIPSGVPVATEAVGAGRTAGLLAV